MPLLQIYLVEDSPVIRESLIATLEELAPVKVVGSADDETAALQWLAGHHSDLVIVDLFLKGGSGLGVLRAAQLAQLAQLAQNAPGSSGSALSTSSFNGSSGAAARSTNGIASGASDNITSGPQASAPRHVVLSNYATPAMRERCMALGADGVFDKSTEIESLIAYCTELAEQTQ